MRKTLLFLLVLITTLTYGQTAEEYYNIANNKSDSKDYQGAIENYTKAIELNPNYSEAYVNRGDTKTKIQDYQGAIADFSKAIELNPKNSDAYYNRGVSNSKLNQKESACLDWIKAEELGDTDAYDLIKQYCKINLLDRYLSDTDKFSGEKTYYGGGTVVSFMKVIGKKNSAQYVSVYANGSTLNYGCYGVSILFENGKKIVRSKEKVDTDYSNSGWQYKAFFTPTLNEINLLKTLKIVAVKLYIYDVNVDESDSNTILKDAKIILTTPKK
jgi:tetratricopeptide (TPR) repeat protein